MRNRYLVVLTVLIVSHSAVRVGARTEDPKPCGRHGLPANLDLPRGLAKTLEQMCDLSSTFRAQCRRVADAPDLCVSVQLDSSMRSSCRAFTIIRRRQPSIRAEVHLPPSSTMLAELIGHEFEHILEQLDGLNLRELARVKGSGVHEVDRDLFETDRAQRTGKTVADEVRAALSCPPAISTARWQPIETSSQDRCRRAVGVMSSP